MDFRNPVQHRHVGKVPILPGLLELGLEGPVIDPPPVPVPLQRMVAWACQASRHMAIFSRLFHSRVFTGRKPSGVACRRVSMMCA